MRQAGIRGVPSALLAPSLIVIFLFVMVPILLVLLYSFKSGLGPRSVDTALTLRSWKEFFSDSYYFSTLLDTFQLALVTTLLCLVFGFIPALVLSRMSSRLRWLLVIALFLPSWIASLVRTMSWISVLGRNGVVNTLLMEAGIIEAPMRLLYNDLSVYLGMVHTVLPLMILNIFIGLQAVDRNVVDAARTLGATQWQAFWAVTWPLTLPSVYAGCMLCFIITSGAYVVPMLLGGAGTNFYPNLIFEAIIKQLDWPMGAALSIVFIVFVGGAIALYGRYMGISSLLREARS